MYSRDYVVRLVQQIVDLLLVVAGLKDARHFPRALSMLDDAYRRFFGWGSDFVNGMPLPYLLDLLSTEGRLDADRAVTLAALVEGEGDVLAVQGREPAARHRHLRALELLLAAHEADDGAVIWEHLERIEPLLERLSPASLPPPTTLRLAGYFERNGRLDAAEDAHFRRLDALGPTTAALDPVDAFYRRLALLPTQLLTRGGLDQDEVLAGQADLARLRAEQSSADQQESD